MSETFTPSPSASRSRPIFNLPIALLVNCILCPTRGMVRGDPRQALDILLSGGWVLLNAEKELFACPRHNPSRTEFVEKVAA